MIYKIKTIFRKKKLQIKKKVRGQREGIEGKEETKEKELKEELEQERKLNVPFLTMSSPKILQSHQ